MNLINITVNFVKHLQAKAAEARKKSLQDLGEETFAKLSSILVVLLAVIFFAGLFIFSNIFLFSFCGGGLKDCLANPNESLTASLLSLFIFAFFRPVFFIPVVPIAVYSMASYGGFWGGVVFTFALILGTIVFFIPSRILAKKFLESWVMANLPDTMKFFKTKDYLFALFFRLTPFVPYDIATLLMGALGFRLSSVIWTSLAGAAVEAAVLFAFIQSSGGFLSPESAPSDDLIKIVTAYGTMSIILFLPVILTELFVRRRGHSLVALAQRSIKEIKDEVSRRNHVDFPVTLRTSSNAGETLKEEQRESIFRTDQIPVLLFYGFFSSRRSIAILYKELERQGLNVLALDLGGFFGVFNSHNIKEIARRVDSEVTRLRDEFKFDTIDIVAHSKGGLIAIWWVFFLMRGNLKVRRVLTLGTPFRGIYLAYLLTLTPFALLVRDGWQMRPNSSFLRLLKMAKNRPSLKELEILCIKSELDSVVRGARGIYEPVDPELSNRVKILESSMTHFSYLSSRWFARKVAGYIKSGEFRLDDK